MGCSNFTWQSGRQRDASRDVTAMTFLARNHSFLIKNLTTRWNFLCSLLMSYWFETMPWQILSESNDPIKVTQVYCIQSEFANLHVGWHVRYRVSSFTGALAFSLSLTFSLSCSLHYIVYPLISKSDNTPTHTVFFCQSHAQTHTRLHTNVVPHLVFHTFSSTYFPSLCLFLTSLYSQLSIDSIPANYLQCLTHYFPISAANLLHTPCPPYTHTTLVDPSALRQLLANFSSVSKDNKERNKETGKTKQVSLRFIFLWFLQKQSWFTGMSAYSTQICNYLHW